MNAFIVVALLHMLQPIFYSKSMLGTQKTYYNGTGNYFPTGPAHTGKKTINAYQKNAYQNQT